MMTASYERRRRAGGSGGRASAPIVRLMAARAIRLNALLGAALLATACASGAPVTARPAPFPRAPLPPVEKPAPVEAAPFEPTAPIAAAVLETALGLRGVPYQFGGAAPETGFDCSGFVRYVFQQHSLVLPRTVTEQFQVGRDVDTSGIQPGDLIFFTTVMPGASHVGIALDAGTFVHAPGSGSVVRLERLDAPYWRSRLVGVKRLLALTIAS